MTRPLAWLLLGLATSVVDATSLSRPQGPPSGTVADLALSTADRTVTVRWRLDTTAPAGYGYLWDLQRCVNLDSSATTNDAKCQRTVELTARDSSSTFIAATSSACTVSCGSLTCCEKTFSLERGWWGRFRLWSVTSDKAVSVESDYYSWITQQSVSAPDVIASFASYTTANDGRHRVFSWTVPRDNGRAIQKYTLRRTYSGSNSNIPAQYDYEFICTQTSSSHDYEAHNAAAATSAQSCSTTSAQCFPAGFACTGDYTGSPLTWSYPAVRVAVGHDVYGGVSDTSYVFPAEAYTWKVIAHNVENLNCAAADTAACDGDDYGAWSTALTATQESATPDVIVTPGFGAITQTSIELTWKAPEDNGGVLQSYQVKCIDAQNAYAYGDWDDERATSASPLVNTLTAACTTPGCANTYTFANLRAGTTYECKLSARNSIGGWGTTAVAPLAATGTMTYTGWSYRSDETVFVYTYNQQATLPDYPADPTSVVCEPILDPVTQPGASATDGNGAPAKAAPSLRFQLSWIGNRPNEASRNTLGAERFKVQRVDGSSFTDLADVDGISSTFGLDMRLVVDESGASGYCGSNRYDTSSTEWWVSDSALPTSSTRVSSCDSNMAYCIASSASFSQLRRISYKNRNADSCRSLCVGTSGCTGIYMRNCVSDLTSTSSCSKCAILQSGSGSLLSSTAVSGSTGRRCYARRTDRRQHAVLLQLPSGSFAYDTSYTFRVKAENPTNGGSHALGVNWVQATCAAQSFRPGSVPSVAVTKLLDRRLFITWGSPSAHGQTIGGYLYSICAVSSLTATACSASDTANFDQPQWASAYSMDRAQSQTRYMCDAQVGGSRTRCSGAAGSPTAQGSEFEINGLSETLTYAGDASPLNVAGLLPSSHYLLVVRSYSTGSATSGIGWASTPVVVRMADNPTSPTLQTGGQQQTSLAVQWSAYTATSQWRDVATATTSAPLTYSASNYKVRIYRPSSWGTTHLEEAETTSLTHSFSGLVAGLSYYVDVKAWVAVGGAPGGGYWTGWSDGDQNIIVTASAVPDAPAAPTLQSGATTRSIAFNITNPTLDHNAQITGFVLKLTRVDTGTEEADLPISSTCGCTSAGDGPAGIQATDSEYSTFTDTVQRTGLRPNTRYTARLVAVNAVGPSPPSPPSVEIQTCAEEPDQLTPAPNLVSNTVSSITVGWSALAYTNGAAVSNYRLQYEYVDTGSTTVRSELCTCGSCNTHTGTDCTSTQLTVPGLTPGVNYTFKVQAYNAIGRTNTDACSVTRPCDSDYSSEAWGRYACWSPISDASTMMRTQITPPDEPTNVRLQVSSPPRQESRQLVIEWDVPYGNGAPITQYTIYSTAVSSGGTRTVDASFDLVGGVGDGRFFSDLTPNTNYTFEVTASNAGGESARSVLARFLTDFDEPDAILAFNTLTYPRSDNSVTLDWTAPTNNGLTITAYQIKYRCPAETQTYSCSHSECPCNPAVNPGAVTTDGAALATLCSTAQTGVCSTTNAAQSNLESNAPYEYSVRAYNGYTDFANDGWSSWSPWIELVTTSSTPLVPSQPAVAELVGVSTTTADVRWSVPSSIELGRTPAINRYTGEIREAYVGSPVTRAEIYTGFNLGGPYVLNLTNLVPATAYTFVYIASNVEGSSQPSAVLNITTSNDVPGAPGVPNAISFTDTSIEFGWTAADPHGSDVTAHAIELCLSDGSSCQTFTHASGTNSTTIPGSYSLSPALAVGTTYRLRVRATNAVGTGAFSAAGQVETAARPDQPSTPRRDTSVFGLDAATTIAVAWDAPEDHGKAITAYEDPNGVVSAEVASLSAPAFAGPAQGAFVASLGGGPLAPNQELWFDVAACNGGGYAGGGTDGCGAFGPNPPLALRTDASVPGPVPTPTVVSITASELEVRVDTASYDGDGSTLRYELRVFTLPAIMAEQIIDLGATAPATYTLTNRQSDLNYAFEARVVNGLGAGTWSDTQWVQGGAAAIPSTPQGLALVSTTSTTITLSWSMPDNNRSYGVFQYVVSLVSSGLVTTLVTLPSMGNCTSGCVATLGTDVGATIMPATTYDPIRVASQNSFALSQYSDSIGAITSTSAPGAVGSLSVTAVGTNFIAVNWTAAAANGAAIERYQVNVCDVLYANSLSSTCTAHNVTGAPPLTSFTATGLAAGRNFTASVQAFNSIGASAVERAPHTHTTLSVPNQCDAPIKRTPPLVGLPPTTTLHIVWFAPYDNGLAISNYTLTISAFASEVSEEVSVPHTDGMARYEFTKVGLHPGTAHSFSIAAVNALGQGATSTATTISTAEDVPGVPSTPVRLLVSQTTVIVGIEPPLYDGGRVVMNYELQVNGTTGGGYVALLSNAFGGSNNYTIHDRNPLSQYIFRVRAGNELGWSDYSDYLIIESVSSLYPSTPGDLLAAEVGPRGFVLHWRMPDAPLSLGVLSYTLGLSSPLMSLEQTATLNQTDCRAACQQRVGTGIAFDALSPNTNHTVTLRASNAYGTGSASVPLAVRTLSTTPDAPRDVTVTGVTSAAMSVQWAAPHDTGGEPLLRYGVYACDTPQTAACVIEYVDGMPPATSVALTGLPPGRNYTLHVQAFNAIGSSSNATAAPPDEADGGEAAAPVFSTHAPPQQCEPPFRAPGLDGLSSTTSIHVLWTPPWDNGLAIVGYNLTVDGTWIFINASRFTPQYLLTGLLPASSHTFAVAAINALGQGEVSNAVQLNTTGDVPTQPRAPSHVPGGDAAMYPIRIYAPYDGGAPITRYEIEVLYNLGGPQSHTAYLMPPLDTYTIAPPVFVQGVEYEIRVRAENALGFSAFSDPLEVFEARSQEVPTPPFDVAAAASGSCSVSADGAQACGLAVQWRQPLSNTSVASFVLEYLTCGATCPASLGAGIISVDLDAAAAGSACAPSIAATSTTTAGVFCHMLMVAPASSYKLQVRASNFVGTSLPSTAVEATTPASAPSQVRGLSVVAATNDSLALNWSAPIGSGPPILEYVAHVCDVEDATCVHVTLDATTAAALAGALPLRVALPPGRNFTVAVEARNALGSSGNASAAGGRGGVYTTLAVPRAGAPPFAEPRLDGLPPESAVLIAWHAPFDNGLPIRSYQLVVDGVRRDISVPTDGGGAREFLHFGLLPGTAHTYSVSATNDLGTGDASSTFTHVTANGPAAEPPMPSYTFFDRSGEQVLRIGLQPSAYSGAYGEDVSHYQLEESVISGSTNDTRMVDVSTSDMYHERARSMVQDYAYRARAVTAAVGAGPWSARLVVPNDFANVASQPQRVSVNTTSVASNGFAVHWQLPLVSKNYGARFNMRLRPVLNTSDEIRLPDEARADVACNVDAADALMRCEHTVTAARPFTEYVVEVAADNSVGTSTYSAADASVTTLADSADPPGGLTVDGAGLSYLSLSFTVPRDNGDPILGYQVDYFDGRAFGRRMYDSSGGMLAGAVSSCADLAMSPGAGAPAAYGSSVPVLIDGLPRGTAFAINASTCNAIGISAHACVCAVGRVACPGSCGASGLPVLTHSVPERASSPIQLSDPSLQLYKSRALFVVWSTPFANGQEIVEVEVQVGNETRTLLYGSTPRTDDGRMRRLMDVSLGESGVNVTGLQPATQYATRVRMRNAIGWGDWSDTAWLSTIPDVPERPPPPTCDAERATNESLNVNVLQADANGQAVLEYQVNLSDSSGRLLLTTSYLTSEGLFPTGGGGGDDDTCTPLVETINASKVEAYARGLLGLEDAAATLTPETQYVLAVRARNALGWSVWSANAPECVTAPTPSDLFDWVPLLIALIILLVLAVCFFVILRFTDLPKILAPRLRRVEEKQDPLEDFIVREDTPIEDFDPELKLNPVVLAKLEVEKQRGMLKRGKQGAKGATWRGGPGALARLGINIDVKKDAPEDKKKANMKNIDVMLQKANQDAPGTETREISKRALTMCSAAKEKKTKMRAEQRMIATARNAQCGARGNACARAAAKMTCSGVPEDDEEGDFEEDKV